MAAGVEFEWDSENTRHWAAHKVSPAEFEQLLNDVKSLLHETLTVREKRKPGRWQRFDHLPRLIGLKMAL